MKTEIKPEELRIGNHILHNNEPCIVFSLSKEWLRVTKDRNIAISYDNISAIPLTEEKLIEMGFEKLPHMTITNSLIKNIGRNRHLSIGDVGTPNLMLWLCAVDNGDNPKEITDLVCLHNWDYDKEMYVHQMQNLIFQLTQTELIK